MINLDQCFTRYITSMNTSEEHKAIIKTAMYAGAHTFVVLTQVVPIEELINELNVFYASKQMELPGVTIQ